MTAFTHKLDQVTYPRMERQDLTQAQLGSFKFTPTDEVRPVFTSTSPRLAQQYIHSLNRNAHVDLPVLTTSTPTTANTFLSYQPSDTAVSPSRFNSTLFDTYFKQDLAKSRLQLGPTALRAAMDGSPTSPQRLSAKRRSINYAPSAGMTPHYVSEQSSSFRSKNANQDQQMPIQDDNVMYNAQPHNAMSASVTPRPEAALVDSSFFQTSLIRALATEQQAHQVTKDALDIEKALRKEAEALAQKYLEHNRSLIGSVNMLKSVVQHNMKKEQENSPSFEHEYTHQDTPSTGQTHTLLHDAVKNLKRPTARAPPEPVVDHTELFNLSLVDSHGSAALRRHFSTAEEHTSVKLPKADHQDNGNANGHFQNVSRRNQSDETWNTGETTMATGSDEMMLDDSSPIMKPISETASRSVLSIPVKTMAMPFDPHVVWHQDPIFEDQEDKFDRLKSYASLFAKHPVRYLPNKSDKNLYRTVMIDFLPNGTTFREVLDNVRGGAVEDIQLFGPIGHSTNFMTARIVFNYELGARSVYMQGQDPGIMIKGKRVRVWQVLEATYPRNPELVKEIFDEGYTRFLLIENASKASLDKLSDKLAYQMRAGSVIEIGQSYDDLPMIEFTSISECSKALKILIDDPDFRGSKFDFEEDPCIDPY